MLFQSIDFRALRILCLLLVVGLPFFSCNTSKQTISSYSADDPKLHEMANQFNCLNALKARDPNQIAFLEEYGFQHVGTRTTMIRNIVSRFDNSEGIVIETSANPNDNISRIEISFNSNSAYSKLAHWLYDRYRLEPSFKNTTKNFPHGEVTEGEYTSYLSFRNSQGQYISGSWNVTEKKDNWIKQILITLPESKTLGCDRMTSYYKELEPIHLDFDPLNERSYYALIGQNVCQEYLDNFVKYYGWKVHNDLIHCSFDHVRLQTEPAKGECDGFKILAIEYHHPDEHKELSEFLGKTIYKGIDAALDIVDCGHYDSRTYPVHCTDSLYHEFQIISHKDGYQSRDLAIIQPYVDNFEFTNPIDVQKCYPKMGCTEGTCLEGAGMYTLPDGCYFNGVFYNGEAWRGFLRDRKGELIEIINRGLTPEEQKRVDEQERDEKRKAEEQKRKAEEKKRKEEHAKKMKAIPVEFFVQQKQIWLEQIKPKLEEVGHLLNVYQKNHQKAYKNGLIDKESEHYEIAERAYRNAINNMRTTTTIIEKMKKDIEKYGICDQFTNKLYWARSDLWWGIQELESIIPDIWEYDAKRFNSELLSKRNAGITRLKKGISGLNAAQKLWNECLTN